MPKITIGTDVVNFPDSGSDALWSPAVIQFAEVIANAVNDISSSPNDISPTTFTINANANPTSLFNIGATFDPVYVRKFTLNYAIYRKFNINTYVEAGVLTGVYNTSSSVWILQDEYFGDRKSDGTSYHNFSINGSNEIELQTEYVAETINTTLSKISFSAKTEVISV